MTVKCRQCGRLGTHLNGPHCLTCGALLPPPGTPHRASDRALVSDSAPRAMLAAARSAMQAAPAESGVAPARAAIERQVPRYDPAPQPDPPRPAAYGPGGPSRLAGPAAPMRPPRATPTSTLPTIPRWILPARVTLIVIAALGYVAALRTAAAANGADAGQSPALAFLALALAASVGSLALRAYMRVQRRRIARQVAYSAAPAARIVIGAAPSIPRNPYAGTALFYGAASVVIAVGAALLGYYVLGLLGLYAVYYSIQGVVTGARLRTHAGLIVSLVGLGLSVFALALTALLATGVWQLMVSF